MTTTKPRPTLVYRADRTKRVEWLTPNECRKWSTYADIAACIVTERLGTFAYRDGVKYDEDGCIVGRHDEFDKHNGWIS